MDYSRVDFSRVPVEQVFRRAADDLYQVAHKVRGEAHSKIKDVPSDVRSSELEDQVAEVAFDEMLELRSAYMMLYACANQMRSNVAWAKASGPGAFQWSTAGRKVVLAMKVIQSAYSEIQDAAMLLPGSEGKDRERYLSLVANPSDSIEHEMVNALLVLKGNP